MSWLASAIFGGSVVSAAGQAYGATQAANAGMSAAQLAANTQMQMFNQTQRYLSPFRQAGQADLATLQSELPYLTSPINMNEQTLEQTPGYQWDLQQGLKAIQNSAAARGLGESGAAQKGAATYATGLADSTYQQQFNNAVTNQTNAYNRLMGLVNLGEGAAAGTGQAAQQTGQGVAGAQLAGGQAAMAGYNAIYGGAGSTLANGLPAAAYAFNKGLYNNGGYSNGPSLGPNVFGPGGFSPT